MTDTDPLVLARRLIDCGVPVFVARRDPRGTGTQGMGYWLPGGWQKTRLAPDTLDPWRPGDALCAVGGHAMDFIDVDRQHDGETTAKRLAPLWPREYLRVKSPSGGYHSAVYRLGIGTFEGYDGLDLRGGTESGESRGFVFLPGTRKASKIDGIVRDYTVVSDRLDSFGLHEETGTAFTAWSLSHPSRGGNAVVTHGDETFDLGSATGPRIGDILPTGKQDAMIRDYCASIVARSRGRYSVAELEALGVAYGKGCDPPWGFRGGDPLEVIVAAKVATALEKFLRVDDEIIDVAPIDLADETAVLDNWQPLDWNALWADESEDEWLCEPLIAAGRGTVLYSPPKVGKSLLTLEIAAHLACGRDALGFRPSRPIRVLVLDHENDPRSDTRDRLKKMGFKPEDLGNLVVMSYPIMATLDTREGGEQALAMAQAHSCDLVVIDTVSRAVAGEENDNFTWLSFYRHTGLVLKRAGIAMLRLDHSGKDVAKGQRGGSAKSSDVDLVWSLSEVVKDETYRLDCTHNRMMVHEKTITIHREQFPLGHRVDSQGRKGAFDARVNELAKMLVRGDAAKDIGILAAERMIKGMGGRPGKRGDGTPLRGALLQLAPDRTFETT